MRVLNGLEAFSVIKKAPREALFSYGRPKSSLLTAVTGSAALFRTPIRVFLLRVEVPRSRLIFWARNTPVEKNVICVFKPQRDCVVTAASSFAGAVLKKLDFCSLPKLWRAGAKRLAHRKI